ncbi:glutathione s-transferase c-terminal domain-containing protein [Plakobranchus ocellatus]|uniref:Glutathione s-transferase c-terminal domain-containing protein n=1 Tax=Plakobranchus ocellatus TaxID=259542 RepID=A0AAV4AXC5_9GAST|nr:glutathione s-transferase c-terminal domain-containing protein [Plakobranchus ocellatus]
MARIYLRGIKSATSSHVICPLSSSCILFFLRYCQTQNFELNFLKTTGLNEGDEAACCEVSLLLYKDISVTFLGWDEAPEVVKNVCLPSFHEPEMSLVRAGLCVVLRHIIKSAHAEAPEKHLIDLLGFRQGSMRMCSEVSEWTKLCEVDLLNSITFVIQSLKELRKQPKTVSSDVETCLTLPQDLIRLEGHFKEKCKVHNDNKRRRAELKRLKKILLSFYTKNSAIASNEDAEVPKDGINVDKEECAGLQKREPAGNKCIDEETNNCLIKKIAVSETCFEVEHLLLLPHGVRAIKVEKSFNQTKIVPSVHKMTNTFSSLSTTASNQKGKSCNSLLCEDLISIRSEQCLSLTDIKKVMTLPGVAELVAQLSYQDIEYVHTYSEGAEMTLADLVLFVYFYFFMEHLDFQCNLIEEHLPSVLEWMKHMVSLPTVREASQGLGWSVSKLSSGGNVRREKASVIFTLPEEPEFVDKDEMELSHCAWMKHRALKPEIFQAFKKLEEANIKPFVGKHPQGENVTVDWDTLPPSVHPKEGDVPEKRTHRKCQQLENLVTAVQAVARPGDAVVDFCSGGGHLGIVLAYLLPHCQIYLVENKEESLLKVCSRLESMSLRNVTLYQCNIDYFIGKFDVGVCLHACGSATDMVQQLCLNARASFVICPCCYGSIHNTHLLTYPRSKQFQSSSITYKDFLTLGHAADQTEFNIALEEQGRECMNLVDSDRAAYARELGYQVTLCSLQPLTCTPKNNLLVGIPA